MNTVISKSFKALSLGVMGATMVGVGLGAAPAEAASVSTSESDFLSNVQSGSYLETFDSLSPTPPPLPQLLSFSQNGFSYTANAGNGFRRIGSAPDFWLTSAAAFQSIVFNFTSGNVSAIGGAFFPRDVDGQVTPENVFLTLSDGTTQTLTNTNSGSFIGLIADPGTFFTSLTVATNTPNVYATVNNLRVGTAVPTAIPTPALLPAAVGFAVAAWRKRKREGAEA